MAVRWEDVGAEPGKTRTAGKAEWVAAERQRLRGWRGAVLIYVPLIYLIFVGGAVAKYSHGARAATGFAVLAVFCACYIALTSLQVSGRATRAATGSSPVSCSRCSRPSCPLAELPRSCCAST
jgi:hypothetical protein